MARLFQFCPSASHHGKDKIHRCLYKQKYSRTGYFGNYKISLHVCRKGLWTNLKKEPAWGLVSVIHEVWAGLECEGGICKAEPEPSQDERAYQVSTPGKKRVILPGRVEVPKPQGRIGMVCASVSFDCSACNANYCVVHLKWILGRMKPWLSTYVHLGGSDKVGFLKLYFITVANVYNDQRLNNL